MFCARVAGHINLANTTYSISKSSLQLVSSSSIAFRLSNLSIYKRFATTLSPQNITDLLTHNELRLSQAHNGLLPSFIKSIECNQLASNTPIEDRLRVSSIKLPDSVEPALILGVFDGHGGGTTADLVSRRLFNYIALSLHPNPNKLMISTNGDDADGEPLKDMLVDLHNSPLPIADARMRAIELDMLTSYCQSLCQDTSKLNDRHLDIAHNLKRAFQQCDDDLSREIQENLVNSMSSRNLLRHYLSAAVSGCCAIVMVIHRGFAHLASSGDCRAVLGIHDKTTSIEHQNQKPSGPQIEYPQANSFRAIELNDEHNCDNINEIRRLATAHPKTEQNTMIKHNRLLGHLMPFRAFGDFTYKWPADVIKACGITRAFGPGVIPSNYETPPYLIVEPDVKTVEVDEIGNNHHEHDNQQQDKYLVMASDGLWELFESSRDVIETIVNHSLNAQVSGNEQHYDTNCATYILRSALCYGPHQDISLDPEKLRQQQHIRLESTLTLPRSIVRNFRDDISIIMLKL